MACNTLLLDSTLRRSRRVLATSVMVLVAACTPHPAPRSAASTGARPVSPTSGVGKPVRSDVAPSPQVHAQATLHAAEGPVPFAKYLLTSAVAVEGRPLTVNREFDFASAMMLDSGAAIAAGKRRKGNEALAASLASIRVPELETAFEQGANSAMQCLAGVDRVNLEGLLFGEDAATLQTVARVERANEPPLLLVHVSRGRPLSGDASWTADNGAALVEQWEAGARLLGRLLCRLSSFSRTEAEAALPRAVCTIGKREAATGVVAGEFEASPVLVSNAPLPPRLDEQRLAIDESQPLVWAVCP